MLLSYKPLHLEAQQRLQEEGCVVDISPHPGQEGGGRAHPYWARPLSPGAPGGPPVPIFCYMKAFTLEKKSEASLRDETPPP